MLGLLVPFAASAVVYTPPLQLLKPPSMGRVIEGDKRPVSLGPWGTVVVDSAAFELAPDRNAARSETGESRVREWLRADGSTLLLAVAPTNSVALAQAESRRGAFTPERTDRF